ncbi:MAG: DUF4340 domain-containing protein [Acidobacteriota bacterium]
MRRETAKTAGFVGAAIVLALAAALNQPESATPEILSDQGKAFYPNFTDPQAARMIELIDYDEATAAARPLKVELQRGRWVIASHHSYPVEIGDRLAKTAAALIDLRREQVRSDSPLDHAQFGVVDPLDQKVAALAGRGKRVTLRDARGDVLADFIFGKPVEGKPGYRYLRAPGEKRTWVVKTEADPSARFADWVQAGLLRVAAGSIRSVTIQSYSIDETFGRLLNMETLALAREGDRWSAGGAEKLNTAVINTMASTLDGLKIADVRPKPPTLAADLRSGQVRLSLETAMSLRQRGFFLSPAGRLLANEGEMAVETANGLVYSLRFGEIAAGSENRHLFVTVSFDAARAAKYGGDAAAGERAARELNNRFADWYYLISGADFQKLRLRRKDVVGN